MTEYLCSGGPRDGKTIDIGNETYLFCIDPIRKKTDLGYIVVATEYHKYNLEDGILVHDPDSVVVEEHIY